MDKLEMYSESRNLYSAYLRFFSLLLHDWCAWNHRALEHAVLCSVCSLR